MYEHKDISKSVYVLLFSAIDEQNEQTLKNKLPTQPEEDESVARTPLSSTASNADSTIQATETSSGKMSARLSVASTGSADVQRLIM